MSSRKPRQRRPASAFAVVVGGRVDDFFDATPVRASRSVRIGIEPLELAAIAGAVDHRGDELVEASALGGDLLKSRRSASTNLATRRGGWRLTPPAAGDVVQHVPQGLAAFDGGFDELLRPRRRRCRAAAC